ncbi:AraC family transcriptional regulator [Algoriphagus namhaensis]
MYWSQSPPDHLNRWISFYYRMSKRIISPDQNTPEPLLPSGVCIFGFHLSGRYVYRMDSKKMAGELPEYYLTGQQSRGYELLLASDQADIFGITLNPTAAWKLLGIPAHSLTDHPVSLIDLPNFPYPPFLRAIAEASAPEEKIDRIKEFFEGWLEKKTWEPTLVDHALDLIFEKKGCLSTRDLCKALHVSERHLQHLFRQQVGVSPAHYARITRFNNIFIEFTRSETPRDYLFLTSFYNYYDTSHFFKDFRMYCGLYPSQFFVDQFHLLKELTEKEPYLLQVQRKKDF